MTWLLFWANYQLFGLNPLPWHAINLVLHMVATALVFDVQSRLIPRKAAIIGTAIFAIHPLQAEVASYVFARSSSFSLIFSLLSLREWTRGRHWYAVAWFVPALLAKEECVTLPLFLALLHLSMSRNRKEWAPITAMLGLSLLAGLRVLFALSVTPGSPVGPNASIKPLEYLGSQGLAILRYLQLLIVPYGFTFDPELPLKTTWWAWAILLGLILASFRQFDRARAGFFFLGGLVLLIPSSSIFTALDLAADRRMYLPMFAFSACIGLLLQRVNPKFLCALGALLFALSVQRSYIWADPVRLWSEAVDRAPDKIRPRLQLARSLPPAQALSVLREAKKITSTDPQVASELGRVLLATGKPAESLAEFGIALAADPRSPRALTNRGVALAYLGQSAAAADDFRRAITVDPCFFEARWNLKRLHQELPPAHCDWTPQQKEALEGNR